MPPTRARRVNGAGRQWPDLVGTHAHAAAGWKRSRRKSPNESSGPETTAVVPSPWARAGSLHRSSRRCPRCYGDASGPHDVMPGTGIPVGRVGGSLTVSRSTLVLSSLQSIKLSQSVAEPSRAGGVYGCQFSTSTAGNRAGSNTRTTGGAPDAAAESVVGNTCW